MSHDDHNDLTQRKRAILGELESIQDLLSEDELANIPVLDEQVGQPAPSSSTPENSTQSTEEIPLLTEAVDHSADDQADQQLREIDQVIGDLELELHINEGDQPLDISTTTTLAQEHDAEEAADEPIAETTAYIDELVEESRTPEDEPFIEEPALDISGSFQNGESEAVASTDKISFAPIEATDETLEKLLNNDAELEPGDIEMEDSVEESKNSVSSSEHHDSDLHNYMAPDALPGQQSLFATSSPYQEAETLSPASTDQKTAKDQVVPLKAKGENPFLPKHIRDRLHTGKSLMETIHEATPQPSRIHSPVETNVQNEPGKIGTDLYEPTKLPVDQDNINQLIDQLVDEYLPQIEAELRVRLKRQLQAIADDEVGKTGTVKDNDDMID